ncbi:hypothetical protein ACU4GR_00175 [Methylobacterium oryzae CBMB20]
MAFLTHQPLWLAYGLGARGGRGRCSAASDGPLRGARPTGRCGRASRRVGAGALAFLALWFGAVLIGLAWRASGLGPWPHRALHPDEAGLAGLPAGGRAPCRTRRWRHCAGNVETV